LDDKKGNQLIQNDSILYQFYILFAMRGGNLLFPDDFGEDLFRFS